jgi:iron(III) transport system substrate-binding protein
MGDALKKRRLVLLSMLVLAVPLVLAAGGTSATASRTAASPPTPKPLSPAAWRALVSRAKQEGSVTIYTTGAIGGQLAAAAAFKQKYGITVTVNRASDAVLAPEVTAEEGTHKAIADIWVAGGKNLVEGAFKNGWVTDFVGPNGFTKNYDRKQFTFGKAFMTGESVLGIAWNTKLVPQGITDIPDLLKPQFCCGKIGAPDPNSSNATLDWYYWLNETYGPNTMAQLAAQKPIVYTSTTPMTQAVISGEIMASPFASAAVADPARAKGAPVQFKLADNGKNWNGAQYAMILKQAPHPAAAQMYANYLLSVAGQTLATTGGGSVIPKIPGAYYVPARKVKLNDFTPAKVSAFLAKWTALFHP